MYVYVLYFNKKMITSSESINDIFQYIFSIFSRKELDKFNPEFYGNDYVTTYTLDNNVIYIIREKTGFVRQNFIKLLMKHKKSKKSSVKSMALNKKEDSENLSVFTPHKLPESYSEGSVRTGLDNKLYKVNKVNDKLIWNLFK